MNFLIFSGPQDYYFPKLPQIVEILVDSLKTNDITLYSLVFESFRILFIRINHAYLQNLWPIIISEMVFKINRFRFSIKY
jgi:hypothetical protein